jgi:hypothetical protein
MTSPRPSATHDTHLREPEVIRITDTCVHLNGNFSLKRLEAILELLKSRQLVSS